jgi:hypothetical protein
VSATAWVAVAVFAVTYALIATEQLCPELIAWALDIDHL